jgi:spore photoproduct lyase
MKLYRPDRIYVEAEVADEPVTLSVLAQARGIPVEYLQTREQMQSLQDARPTWAQAKRQLVLARHRGKFLKGCQGCTDCRVHCNYFTVTYATNCHLECTYCILQAYLNNPFMRVYANIPDLIAELETAFSSNPKGVYRVGTGELSDSLGLDHLTGISGWLVPFFARYPNAALELKTKTDNVENLLRLPASRNTVVAWSINVPSISEQEEWKTATLDEKFAAARRCADHGYPLAFHFDPMLHFAGWEDQYRRLVDALFDRFAPTEVAWLSLGALRFHGELRDVVRWRFPRTSIFRGELIRGSDGKYQYFKPVRVEMYARMLEWIRRRGDSTVYLCMETADVQEKVFGRPFSGSDTLGREMDRQVLVTIQGASG